MTPFFPQLTRRFSRLRAFVPTADRRWTMGGARANPDLRGLDGQQNVLDLLVTAWQRYRIRQRWRHDLQRLDDRELHDIGITRDEAERVIKQFRFWV